MNPANQGGVRPSVAASSVAIVGGGVIGLGIGWRLAASGCQVTVFERGEAAHGATWAAGGMLCAGVEIEPGEEKLWDLSALSQRLWPEFRDALQAASGQDIGYRDEGTIVIALSRDDREQLRFHYELQTKVGVPLHWLTGAEVRAREPYLHTGTVAGYACASDHQVDSRFLALALKKAFVEAGGTLAEHSPVEELDLTAGRVTGVRVGEKVHKADLVVLAAGAWSRQLKGIPDAVRPPVRPVRGQLLVLRMDAAEPLVRHVVWAPKAYLIPRRDGRLLIGATTEERGFDDRPTAGGVFSLLDGAWRALPGVEELPLEEIAVGFRPGSRDDMPILGPSGVDGLVMATGHHRNGILLTPVTVETVCRYILTGEVMEAMTGYLPSRFTAASSS